jgi:hypothetical protein
VLWWLRCRCKDAKPQGTWITLGIILHNFHKDHIIRNKILSIYTFQIFFHCVLFCEFYKWNVCYNQSSNTLQI